MSDTPSSPTAVPSTAGITPAAVSFNEQKLAATYANFCRVTGTPEELVVDFGLNLAYSDADLAPIELTPRVVMNFYTAKRLFHALAPHWSATKLHSASSKRMFSGALPDRRLNDVHPTDG